MSNALNEFFKVDPVLFVIGICGVFLCANKKRYRTCIMGIMLIITANHTLHNFVIFAFITQHLPDFKNTTNDHNNNKAIMIGSIYLCSQYWLYKYVFNKDFDLLSLTDAPINDTHFTIPFKTQKMLFIADSFLSQVDEEGPLKQINQLYNNTHTKAIFDRGLVKVRSNYYNNGQGTYSWVLSKRIPTFIVGVD